MGYYQQWFITSCIAHIVNLATQALITAHTKSKHYDPAKPDDDLVVERGVDRDEVGLVRSITVKVVFDHSFTVELSLTSNKRSVHLANGSRSSLTFNSSPASRTQNNFCWICQCGGLPHMSCWNVLPL